jgi:hypothetical protein
MAQFARFNDGGFVLHKCLGKRISAWYDKNGALKDHVLINSLGDHAKPARRTLAH